MEQNIALLVSAAKVYLEKEYEKCSLKLSILSRQDLDINTNHNFGVDQKRMANDHHKEKTIQLMMLLNRMAFWAKTHFG